MHENSTLTIFLSEGLFLSPTALIRMHIIDHQGMTRKGWWCLQGRTQPHFPTLLLSTIAENSQQAIRCPQVSALSLSISISISLSLSLFLSLSIKMLSRKALLLQCIN
jgi:hypothetical protein